MARTSVSRRLVYIKKTKNPVAPLPQQRTQSEQKTPPAATFAAAPRPAVRPSGSRKLLKSAAIFVGLICAGAAIATMGRARTPSAADYAAVEARMAAPSRAATISASDDYQSVGLPSILSQRSAPTDESFRAAGYARRR